MPRNDRFLLERDVADVQPELGFALVFVRPMAGITILGEKRADVAIESYLICLGSLTGRDEKDAQKSEIEPLVPENPLQSSGRRKAREMKDRCHRLIGFSQKTVGKASRAELFPLVGELRC